MSAAAESVVEQHVGTLRDARLAAYLSSIIPPSISADVTVRLVPSSSITGAASPIICCFFTPFPAPHDSTTTSTTTEPPAAEPIITEPIPAEPTITDPVPTAAESATSYTARCSPTSVSHEGPGNGPTIPDRSRLPKKPHQLPSVREDLTPRSLRTTSLNIWSSMLESSRPPKIF